MVDFHALEMNGTNVTDKTWGNNPYLSSWFHSPYSVELAEISTSPIRRYGGVQIISAESISNS